MSVVETGFDMVPMLTKGEDDAKRWTMFISKVRAEVGEFCGVELQSTWVGLNFGSRPRLPLEGHKFRRFSSKVEKGSAANDLAWTVIVLAKECFGCRVRGWTEEYGQRGFYSREEMASAVLEASESPTYTPRGNEPNPMDPMNTHLYEVKEVPNKGKGLVAKIKIDRATRVITEKPLFMFSNVADEMEEMAADIASELRKLKPAEQREFLSLTNAFPGRNSFAGIAWTCAFPTTTDPYMAGIFPILARVNHCCSPNAYSTYNETIGCQTLHALRDIEAGEEITLDYDRGDISRTRRQIFSENFRFTCTCSLCSLPSDQLRESDVRRYKIKLLEKDSEDESRKLNDPAWCLGLLKGMVRCYREEFDVDPLYQVGRVYEEAADLCLLHSDVARGTVFGERAYKAFVLCMGYDNQETMEVRRWLKDPAKEARFGLTTQWLTRVEDAPRHLELEEWQDWIWQNAR